jgi:digeranylgeranylglycerophospholipid reductase
MSINNYDIVVVGGGPAGAIAAKTAAEQGARVLLLEGHRHIGRPVQCTGLLSVRGFEEAGADRGVILREIRGAFAYGPNGRRLAVEKPRVHAYVMDRERFDCDLIRRAQETGVEVRVGAPAVGWESGQLFFKAAGQSESVKAKVVIGADGPDSRVAKWAGLPPPQKTIIAIQVTIPLEVEREDYVEVFLSQRIAPNFFAWIVPAAPGYARVGLGTDDGKRARAYLDAWLRERFAGKRVLEFNAGAIPIGPAARTTADGALLVGDAAGQAKPTSGGGIYTGVTCARLAGEVAAHAALAGDVSQEALDEYERRWRALFESELRFGMFAHQLFCRVNDEEINGMFAALDDPPALRLLGEYGDIDYPSQVVKALLKRPDLWGRLLPAVPFHLDVLFQALKYLA